MRAIAIALLLCSSCDRRAPIARCTDDLAGVYEVETTATESEPTRWAILDSRHGLEIYPLFDDTPAPSPTPPAPPLLELAPRAIDLRRTDSGTALVGQVTRRYMQGARSCNAKAVARITSCTNDTLELVLADPVPPVGFDPCTWGQTAPSRRERWRRVSP